MFCRAALENPSSNGVFQLHGAKVGRDTEGGAANHNLSRLEL
jgi:hypothetical protein